MASETEELESTLEALSVILGDEETFDHVCKEVFKTIDVDGSGSLDKNEKLNLSYQHLFGSKRHMLFRSCKFLFRAYSALIPPFVLIIFVARPNTNRFAIFIIFTDSTGSKPKGTIIFIIIIILT